MANKNDRMVVAYYHNEDAARYAAEELKLWDKANADIKLGAIAIVTLDPKTGELKADEVGQRKTKGGALWGTALGAVAGLMTGGLALVPAVLVGAGGGGAVGAMFHKKVGMSDEDREKMAANLRSGGAVLVVMADDFEVEATEAEMVRLGGTVTSYVMPEETKVAIAEAVEAQAEAAAAVDEAVEAVPEETAETEAAVAAADAGAGAGRRGGGGEDRRGDQFELGRCGQAARSGHRQAFGAAGAGGDAAGAQGIGGRHRVEQRHDLGGREEDGLDAHPRRRRETWRAAAGGGRGYRARAGPAQPEESARGAGSVNADKQIVVDLPKEAEVADWVARAKAAPRIIMY